MGYFCAVKNCPHYDDRHKKYQCRYYGFTKKTDDMWVFYCSILLIFVVDPMNLDWFNCCKTNFFVSFRLLQWVKNTGNPDLLRKSLAQIKKNSHVCNCHFNNDDFILVKDKMQLKPDAIPTQNISVPPLTDEQMTKLGQPLPELKLQTICKPIDIIIC